MLATYLVFSFELQKNYNKYTVHVLSLPWSRLYWYIDRKSLLNLYVLEQYMIL
jgi:hypothetical protein